MIHTYEFELRGEYPARNVWLMGKPLSPEKSQQYRNHSPDGFNWGYGGSGASQLALGVFFGLRVPSSCIQLYQDFKWAVIAKLDQGQDFSVFVKMEIEETSQPKYFRLISVENKMAGAERQPCDHSHCLADDDRVYCENQKGGGDR